jgi:hypothetical protein
VAPYGSPPPPEENRVHVTLTRVATGDQPVANATIVGEEMHRWLRDMEGFEGMLLLSRKGETLGFAFWASREAAERNSTLRTQFVERMASVAGVEILERVDYELTFAELAALTHPGTG